MQNLVRDVMFYLHHSHTEQDVIGQFYEKLRDDKPTKGEDPQHHLCVYFPAIDLDLKLVYMGLHIKSGKWLFNGGHIKPGESIGEALMREMEEELGRDYLPTNNSPELFTITHIDNDTQECKTHYDIWCPFNVSMHTFAPPEELVRKEFHVTKWLTISDAEKLTKDPATLTALQKFKQMFE